MQHPYAILFLLRLANFIKKKSQTDPLYCESFVQEKFIISDVSIDKAAV
jgi:hypothetical protein